jgi:SAM-dependent methyltransferase
VAGAMLEAVTYARHAGFVPALGAALLEWLEPRPGERVLDLGCGDGVLTAAIAASGAVTAGLDPSPSLVRAARDRGLAVVRAAAPALPFRNRSFDAVFSNAVLHWIADPAPTLAAIAGVLRPGGRLVAELGGHGNVAAIVTALRAVLGEEGAPRWFFPTEAEFTARLAEAGLRVTSSALLPRPTPLATGMAGWLATFAAPFLAARPEAERAVLLARAEALLAPALRSASGDWIADYVRLRVVAVRT